MNLSEMIGVAVSGAGIAFGFGTQSNRIAVLRGNVNDMAKLHRETVKELHDVNVTLAGIQRDIEYLKDKAE